MIAALVTLTVIFAAVTLILYVVWPLLPAGPGRHQSPARPVIGASAGSPPPGMEPLTAPGTVPDGDGARLSAAPSGTAHRQPWHTAELPALPAPEPQHAYDPGDGNEPPVALVRPYLRAYDCCECCDDCGQPHGEPCEGGCNEPAPNTDAETLALYQRGAWGTMPEQRAAEAERLTGAYLP